MSTVKLKGTNIELDFNQIRSGIKTYLSGQSEFSDYNFEGSGMAVLIDLLAYNTHLNAMIAHLGSNEAFLTSAVDRSNVVAAAKNIGYTPRSVSASVATVTITVVPPTGSTAVELTLPRGTSLSGGGYTWYVNESVTVSISNGMFIFTDVEIYEGSWKSISYYYDSRFDYQRFQIPDANVDTNTLSAKVRDSRDSTSYVTYSRFTSFGEIETTDRVFFIQENSRGLFEVYFPTGDSFSHPETGNVITMEYVYSSGSAANGIRLFSMIDYVLDAEESVTVLTTSRSANGAPKESIESVRFNAPMFYSAQNRAVTVRDYVSLVKNLYGGVETITCWGGEYNDPPNYGSVYLCVKPVGADTLTDAQKSYIVSDILKPRSVATITPIMIDPEYTYLKLDIEFKYDNTATSYTSSELEDMVRATTVAYGATHLTRFDGVFRLSRFLTAIDATDQSITNSFVKTLMVKKITPSVNSNNEFLMYVSGEIFNYDPDDHYLTSTAIRINGENHYVTDYAVTGDDDTRRLKMIKYGSGGAEVVVIDDVGWIKISTKQIYLNNFRPDNANEILIYVKPRTNDFHSVRNQLVVIDSSIMTVAGTIDTIATTGTSGTSTYVPTRRE